jgi:hypothetical protein
LNGFPLARRLSGLDRFFLRYHSSIKLALPRGGVDPLSILDDMLPLAQFLGLALVAAQFGDR